jgi:uracil-DNA glycosylase family 4
LGGGPHDAKVMLVGEQPGDREDMEGKPFIGPAGAILDRALDEAGLTPGDAYVTNAVKHFSWEPRGKRRIHKKPRVSEMKACRPWLEAEIEAVGPAVIVCLGATAARTLLGAAFRLTAQGRRPRRLDHLAAASGALRIDEGWMVAICGDRGRYMSVCRHFTAGSASRASTTRLMLHSDEPIAMAITLTWASPSAPKTRPAMPCIR